MYKNVDACTIDNTDIVKLIVFLVWNQGSGFSTEEDLGNVKGMFSSDFSAKSTCCTFCGTGHVGQ